MFYLDHRRSYDLDLFTDQDVDGLGLRNLMFRTAVSIGAECRSLQTSPDFHRFELRRGGDKEIIDLVVDRVPQIHPNKPVIDGIRVDPIEEIIANKWAALVGRSELKDLLDLYFLERAGCPILAHFATAQQKDAGLDPAILSHLLASFRIETLPAYLIESIDLADLRSFADRIRRQLADRAFPGG
jgi:hypothetical protein